MTRSVDIVDLVANQKKTVYLPFTNVNVGGLVLCADGNAYDLEPEEDWDDEDEDRYEAVEEEDNPHFGDTDTLGFLVKMKDGNIHLQTAILFGGMCPAPPWVEVIEQCGIFEQPIRAFLNRFMSSEN